LRSSIFAEQECHDTNIKAIHEDKYVDNVVNYKSSIQHELEGYNQLTETVLDYSITWTGVSIFFNLGNFGFELNRMSISE
jgi:hypothetical protein